MSKPWSVSLYSCCGRPRACVVSFFIPLGICCLQAYAVDKANHKGKCWPFFVALLLPIIGGTLNRETIRQAIGIYGSCFGSFCVSCCCEPCAAVQEYRQVF